MSNAKAIWDYLIKQGINAYGAAGIMGNLYAESGLSPNNLQNTYETKLGMNDAAYTTAVDNGTYTNFVHDSAGYGLAQWTFWSRKEGLYKLAKTRGKSIGDLEVQLAYVYAELKALQGFEANVVKATSIQQSSDFVLLKYERPLDQSQTIKNKRQEYAKQFYNEYAAGSSTRTSSIPSAQTISVPAVQYSSIMIGHASQDENGKASGGQAGDQTGKEVCIRTWYSGNWDVLLRPKSSALAEKMAQICEWICNSNLVGYDQTQRNTLYNELEKINWNYKALTTKCETDCSALMGTCAKAAGSNVKRVYGNCCYTGNQQELFLNTGDFVAYTESKYLTSNQYVKRGDILLRTSGHTAMVLSNGPLSGGTNTPTTIVTGSNPYSMPLIILKQGSKGQGVSWVQYALYKAGFGVGEFSDFVDGDFGANTKTAVMRFQTAKGLEVDGEVGPITRAALKKV